MKFDPAKTYPHPVLRPESTDYPDAEFQVEIQLDRAPGGTALRVVAEFVLSDRDLLGLVGSGHAQYVLHVVAPRVHVRIAAGSVAPRISKEFDEGELHGQIVFSAFLVCTRPVPDFAASGWHEDYGSLRFDLEAGSVLAQDEPKGYWIDTAEEMPVGSIFTVRRSRERGLQKGMWRCGLTGDKVAIEMSEGDYKRFVSARNRVNRTGDAPYLMNGVYLPALVWVLNAADGDPESHEDRRWFRALQAQLAREKCADLGADGADRLLDAQRLLRAPFSRMALMSDDAGGGSPRGTS